MMELWEVWTARVRGTADPDHFQCVVGASQ